VEEAVNDACAQMFADKNRHEDGQENTTKPMALFAAHDFEKNG
jgi:hypothetical protein